MSWGRRREQTGRGMFYSIKICETALKLIRRAPALLSLCRSGAVEPSSLTQQGLVPNHAYSILRVVHEPGRYWC